jgi:flagellar hook-associated protein 1 FlgK
MTISGALSNAMSGLRAAGRASEVVSSNISNVMTEGYGQRSLSLSPNAVGGSGGVLINGVIRNVDPVLIADRRLADAQNGNANTKAAFLAQLETLVGDPESEGSLTARLTQFEVSLISAASRPDITLRLDTSLNAAKDLAGSFKRISDGVQTLRSQADGSINTQVSRLNKALQQVETLNARIAVVSRGRDSENAALLDQRQRLIDEIGEIVPVREVARDLGAIALFTTGGAILLDGPAATLSFSPTPTIAPHMTQSNGLLSGLMINGIPVSTNSTNGAIRGGTLGAQFAVRDELSVTAQTQLDAVARDLVERFQDPAIDPTLSPGDPGLFTDNGLALDPLNEVGLAARLKINAAVDPAAGGDIWRLRAGIGATAPGDPGDGTLLSTLKTTLHTARLPGSISLAAIPVSAFDLSAQISARVGADRYAAEQDLSFAAASLNTLEQLELETGVDTDAELQNLMVIEQAYAANARVIAAVDDMMQSILRL